jgi:hypothetical protein
MRVWIGGIGVKVTGNADCENVTRNRAAVRLYLYLHIRIAKFHPPG